MKIRMLFAAMFSFVVPVLALAQQPQAQTQPLYAVNAKWVNGVAPGYWPTPGSGLTLNISAGTVFCLGTIQTYAGGTLTMANNTTNYVYLDTTASCAPASNTSGFSGSTIPLAKVVTSSGAITTPITDDRTTMSTSVGTGSVVGGACAAGKVAVSISTTGVPTCVTVTSAYVDTSIALTGTDINTSNQITATHLAAALPVNQGGTGTTSTLTGIVRGGSPLTASEISGDCTTSGSNAITCTKTSGNAFAASATTDATNASNISSGSLPDARISTNVRRRGIGFTIGIPGGTALTSGSTTTDYVTVPFACTISAYNLAIDAGTITVKFWKVATGTAIPTSGNSISTSGVSISSGTAIHSTTVTDFTTTTVTANDIIAMNVSTVSGAAYINGVLQCDE